MINQSAYPIESYLSDIPMYCVFVLEVVIKIYFFFNLLTYHIDPINKLGHALHNDILFDRNPLIQNYLRFVLIRLFRLGTLFWAEKNRFFKNKIIFKYKTILHMLVLWFYSGERKFIELSLFLSTFTLTYKKVSAFSGHTEEPIVA